MQQDFTKQFELIKSNKELTREILKVIFKSLQEKGYDPISQLVGYLISGEPTYITNYNGARSLIRKLERDVILEEVMKFYLGVNE